MLLVGLKRQHGQHDTVELAGRLQHFEWIAMDVDELRSRKQAAQLCDASAVRRVFQEKPAARIEDGKLGEVIAQARGPVGKTLRRAIEQNFPPEDLLHRGGK